MFGWTRPKCPVQPELKLWIERRMAWLTDRFGWSWLVEREIILPTDEHFPDPYAPTEDGARRMLDRLCGYMGVAADSVDLCFWSEASPPEVRSEGGSVGCYGENEGRHVVVVEERCLLDPGMLAATLAHELAHAILLSNGHLRGSEPDHEPLTDLFTVFQGFGVVTANSFLRDANSHYGTWEAWYVARFGYLGFDAFSYALALFAWTRQDDGKNWDQWLRADVRTFFRKSLAYLEKTGDSTYSRSGELRPEWLVDYPVVSGRGRQEEPSPVAEDSTILADDLFSVGLLSLNEGRFDEAVECFSDALEQDPDDEEIYLHRGEAYLGLGDFESAYADACACVELDPDDVDGVFLRGRVLCYLEAYSDAAADFEYLIREEGRGSEGLARKWRYHHWRGRVFVAEGELQKALGCFSRAINFAPMQVEPFIDRSRLYQQIGRLEEARGDYEKARQLNAELADRELGPHAT